MVSGDPRLPTIAPLATALSSDMFSCLRILRDVTIPSRSKVIPATDSCYYVITVSEVSDGRPDRSGWGGPGRRSRSFEVIRGRQRSPRSDEATEVGRGQSRPRCWLSAVDRPFVRQLTAILGDRLARLAAAGWSSELPQM